MRILLNIQKVLTLLIIFTTGFIFTISTKAEAGIISITVHAGESRMYNEPVYKDLSPGSINYHLPICLKSDDQTMPGQIEMLDDGTPRLWWLVSMSAGSSKTFELFTDQNCNSGNGFSWVRVNSESTQLRLGSRPVIQYEHPVYDPDDIESTLKPFHHVFDPSGGGLITKGPGGLYPHHRGIYFGYYVYAGDNRIDKSENDEDRIDIWHARHGERSEHSRIIKEFAGPVMGGHVLEILWKNHDGDVIVTEQRDIRVFKQPRGEVKIDFSTSLQPAAGPVKLGGDRQHAGVQFRAAQYVADHREATQFIRPERVSHLAPDYEIGGEEMYDLPWNAMHFTIEDRSYTTTYITHPDNPTGAEMSERRYGRFGEFVPHDLRPDHLLNLNYRFWITAGDAPGLQKINQKYGSYASSPVVELN